jgi:hypothetical protein
VSIKYYVNTKIPTFFLLLLLLLLSPILRVSDLSEVVLRSRRFAAAILTLFVKVVLGKLLEAGNGNG